jgi:ferredoxin
VCGTCRTRKLAGEVQMNQGGGLRPREVAQGWMLPCCSKPLSDIELDR